MLLAEEDMSLFPNQRVVVLPMGTYLSLHLISLTTWIPVPVDPLPNHNRPPCPGSKLAVLRLPRKQVRAGHPNVLYLVAPEPPNSAIPFFLSLCCSGRKHDYPSLIWMDAQTSQPATLRNTGQSWAYCCIFWQVCVFIKSCRMLATPFIRFI